MGKTIIQLMLESIIRMMQCKSAMGETDHIKMMEYLDNYPNLKTIPDHEVEYIAYKILPKPDDELKQLSRSDIYFHHDNAIKAFVDLSKHLPQDSDIVNQINQYQEQPWTASFEDLHIISERIRDCIINKKC
jgi:hypothetical protein